jgi:hypothetical protein
VVQTCLILDDKIGDPIADLLLKRPIDDIQIIDLSRFLSECGVKSDNRGRLSIGSSALRPVSVIDRVVEISPATVEAIGGPDTVLQRGQVFAAYQALISPVVELSVRRQYTCLGKLVPLPTQWHLVQKRLPQTHIPKFIYGYGPVKVDTTELLSPIHKSPFDLYAWKPNKRPEGMPWDELVVDRPKGRPFLSFQLGGELIVEPLDGGSCDNVHDMISPLFPTLLEVFAAEIGEALWFVDGRSITFAAFSHFLAGAAKSARFEDATYAFLVKSKDRAGTLRVQ